MIDPLNPNWKIVGRFAAAFFGDEARAKIGDEIHELAYQIDRKEFHVENLRQRVDENFSTRINNLRREKFYPAFNYSTPANLLTNIKADMRRELDAEISRDKQELEAIDKMIARINEIALQSTR